MPEGWCWRYLSDIGTWQSGATPSRGVKAYFGGSIPWLKTGDLNDDYVKDIPERITDKALKETSVKLNPEGSVLIAMYGATIGKVGILTFPATTNQACCACSELCGVDNRFLFYFLISHKEEFIRQAGGGAQPNISKEIIVNTPIPVPPAEEQKRIVSEIEMWLGVLKDIDKSSLFIHAGINNCKARILDLAIHGKLVPQDPSDEPAIELLKRINPNFTPSDNLHYKGSLPKGWCFSTIGDLFQHNTGKALNGRERDGDGLRYITTSNLYWDRFDLTEVRTMPFTEVEKEKCRATKGDLLVCEGGDIGRAAIWPYDYDVMIQNHIHRLRPKTNLSVRFFYYIILLYKQQGLIGGKGIAILGLSSRELDRMVVPVPPVEEQHRIVAGIKTLFTVLEEIQTGLEA
ncbi:MAG: restriction endonuclease subunit S [Bacteroidales bacterium]|nr:restriction endonuclease subunit S [Bacteroidales bacterium]